jgi:hypothetical protein
MVPDALICTDLLLRFVPTLRFVNRFCGGGALGTSAALFTVCVHTVSSPYYEGGNWVIHFALQALQLYATPANPSPHTTSVRAKLYKAHW